MAIFGANTPGTPRLDANGNQVGWNQPSGSTEVGGSVAPGWVMQPNGLLVYNPTQWAANGNNFVAPGQPTNGLQESGTQGLPPGSGALGPNGQPVAPTTGAPGANGQVGGGNTGAIAQGASLGGTYTVQQYPINMGAITQSPQLDQIYGNLNSAVNTLQPQNYSYTAPTASAALGSAAQGTAAQGTGAFGSAAQGAGSSYNASTGNAANMTGAFGSAASMTGAQGNAMFGNAALQNGPSQGAATTGTAAQGQASTARAAQISGIGPQGAAAFMTPAQMQAAQQGYAGGQAAQISTAGDSAWQAQQAQLANQLALTANGQGASPADLQLKAGTDATIAAQMSMLGSQRGGGNPALAANLAGNQSAAALANLNQQMGIQRAGETLNAQNALGSVLGTARGQSQNYNLNQANLNQGMTLADLQNAQAALTNNAQFRNAAASQNASMSQGAAQSNQAQRDAMTQANMSMAQQTALANLANNQQTNIFNAGQGQGMTLADMAAANNMTQFNAGQLQNMTGLNMSMAQNTGQFNAGQQQGMTLANMNAGNTMTAQNMASLNNANALNANLGQGMSLANMASANNANQFNAGALQNMTQFNAGAMNNANQFNAGQAQNMTQWNGNALNQMTNANMSNAQAMNLANLNAQNTFGLQNMSNAQGMTLANMGNSQATNLANLGQAGSALANNQNAALAANQNYYNQLLGLSGAQSNIASSNRAAELAAQQLAVQQNIGLSQTAASAYASGQGAQQNGVGNAINAFSALVQTGVAIWNAAKGGYQNKTTGAPIQAPPGYPPGATPTNLPPPQADNGTIVPGVGGTGAPGGADANGTPVWQDPATGGWVYGDGSPAPDPGGTSSDENLKTGIQGGNPMLDSFLRQYRSSDPLAAWNASDPKAKAPSVDPMATQDYRPGVYADATSSAGGLPSPNMGPSDAGTGVRAATSIAGAIPVAGPFISGVGKFVGDYLDANQSNDAYKAAKQASDLRAAEMASGEVAPPPRQQIVAPQYTHFAPIQDNDQLITSDDREKESIMSGNQGMQAFLQQANAQQGAQSNQGSTNNAFMQVGQAPSAQVDRQLPPMQDPNMGYGAQQGVSPMSFSGGDTGGWGGGAGVFGGGMTQGAGQINPGGWSQGGMSQGGIAQQGGMTQSGAGSSGGGTFGGGLASSGGFTPGSMTIAGSFGGGGVNAGSWSGGGLTSQGGMTSQGGVSGGSISPGGMTSAGGFSVGSGNTSTQFAAPPTQFVVPANVTNNVVSHNRPIPSTAGFMAQPPPAGPQLPPGSGTGNNGNFNPLPQPWTVPGANSQRVAPPAIDTTTGQPVNWATLPPALATTPAPNFGIPAESLLAGGGAGMSTATKLARARAEAAAATNITTLSPTRAPAFSLLSDEREKKDIDPSPGRIQSMLDQLHAYQYRYKDPTMPGARPGPQIGVMAQDLEKSPLGSSFVLDTDHGKKVDYGKAASTMMAGLAYHNERLDHIDQMLSQLGRSRA